MFFKIYFSEEKFRKDASAFNQKQIDRAARDYYRILSASPDEQYISPLEAKKKIWQANSDFAINNIGEVLGGLKRAREELFALDTYASEEACQQELAYYRSKPGIGVRYFMEKKNDQ